MNEWDDYLEGRRPWLDWTPQSREDRDYMYPRDDAYEERETSWEASPDYDELMERETHEVVGEEEPNEWPVWLAEGCRPVPNG